MRKPQDDLRYRKTEALIQNTFRELLGEMDYAQITVQKLAQRAQINRKTFYLHYPSIDELLRKMQAEIVEDFLAPVKDARLPGDLEKVVRNCYVSSEKFDALNEKILNSQGHFPIDKSQGEQPQFFAFDTDGTPFSPEQSGYLISFVSFSLTALYRQWVFTGRRESMEEMIQLTIRLISGGLNSGEGEG